jgi:hypothetical protein|uniref:Uncharacterized protein n=1 Tax=viral metagenome TaxID=1070528 RepID=A0A6C0IS62_9ZZZZ
MEEKKLLKINLSDFSFSNNKSKKKKTEKPEGNIRIRNSNPKKQATTLRKKSLLNLIRQQQQKQYDAENNLKNSEPKDSPHVSSFNKEFDEAKNYLNTIADKRSTHVSHHNSTLRTRPPIEPSSIITNQPASNEPVQNDIPTKPTPVYGCLKNGNLPTYRKYMNKTVSNREPLTIGGDMDRSAIYNQPSVSSIPTNESKPASQSALSNRFPSLYSKQSSTTTFPVHNKKSRKIKQRKTIRRKHKVGRSKYYSKIGVLVSNKTIRNHVSNQIQQLKMVPMHDVRGYLIKNGFIKVGSNTPNDVLRKMYETALLICGEVKNHNPDNLLYNFLNGDTEGDN